MGTVGADEAMRALDAAMRTGEPNIVVLPVLPHARAVPMLADVAPAEEPEDGTGVTPVDRDGADLSDVAGWVSRQVIEAVATELGLPEADIDPRVPLVETGVDSIMTVALRRALESRTGLALPPTLLWEHPTASAITDRIVDLLTPQDDSPTEGAREEAEVS
jgi:6-methylsalicylic acid synthase